MPGFDQNMEEQLKILSPKMAHGARCAVLNWTYARTTEASKEWRERNALKVKGRQGENSLGIDYRTILRIEQGLPVQIGTVVDLRETYIDAGVRFTVDDVVTRSHEETILKINGFEPVPTFLRQESSRRLKEILASQPDVIEAAYLMEKIIAKGMQAVQSGSQNG
ncbi:hypothetical protein [Thalassospira xiamenensis]|jgi:hypothetical protein|uniref:hypothetical protein n=1 Tax=Thalassospira xiamenensis TaxID=220697 RepID=UPI0011BE2A65|nr:hypothetical protein [Thalassospira xiamenensis]